MFSRRLSRLACTLLLLLPVWAQAQSRLHVNFKQVTLKNGLRVILIEDHSAPTYAISMTYDVGSRNEVKGRTGFAHLFEHMMFQGSQNVGKGEHMALVQENGGTMNGSTNQDRTNYFEALPSNQLELGLFLESDRMRSLAVNQANLENQRNTVQEERRLRVDNQPYGLSSELMEETAYDNFAYKHSVIGSMDDLNAATLDDVKQFFATYYAPNNAVMALVGDFKTDEALKLVKKYFEDIPSHAIPPYPDMTEPPHKAERRQTLEDKFAPMPRISIAYVTVPGNTPDYYALDMLFDVLGSGESSRLYQALVKDKQLALSVMARMGGNRGPGLASIMATPRPGVDPADLEKAIYDEIEKIKNEAPSDAELQKVRMRMRSQRAFQLQSTLGRANMLGVLAVYYKDAGLINTEEAQYDKVTRQDLQRVAKTYLEANRRTVITTLPAGKGAGRATGK